jgi:hypothetical protein
MQPKKIGKISGHQDGVIWGDFLFSFNSKGVCGVHRMDNISDDPTPISQFTLDKSEIILPHSNCVVFGNERYCEDDEFPLLYCNIYNNYAKSENKLLGVTCVYRLERSGNMFSTTLLQLIEIGFTDDPVWKSSGCNDVRPYGNFAIDAQNKTYYAFTMRDEEQTTRYFTFDLPNINDGTYDDTFGVKRVVLSKEDILSYFDCEYHRYIQGACFHNGTIYSVEGFTNSEINPPAIRLIDVHKQKQDRLYYFADCNMHIEPEFIDFENETCYYADHDGNVFILSF